MQITTITKICNTKHTTTRKDQKTQSQKWNKIVGKGRRQET